MKDKKGGISPYWLKNLTRLVLFGCFASLACFGPLNILKYILGIYGYIILPEAYFTVNIILSIVVILNCYLMIMVFKPSRP